MYDRRKFDGTGCHEAFLPEGWHADGKLRDALLAEDEKLFQSLWKVYFSALSIKARINLTLQRRCMPRRFCPYLTEKQE